MMYICGQSMAETAPDSGIVLLPWVCPLCEGTGRWNEGERCHECRGRGAITDEDAKPWKDVEGLELTATPVPPAVMRSPCADCAFRPGAPEEGKMRVVAEPFYCHHGMPVVNGSYAPTAWADGKPLGAMVCRGWWDTRTGQTPPTAPYRPAKDGWGEA